MAFYHSAEPLSLSTRSGGKTTLSEVCKSSTPPCRLNPLLFNGHLQTFYTVRSEREIPIYYKRKIFEHEDPTYAGTFAVDFVVDKFAEEDATLPSRTVYFGEEEFERVGSLDSKPMLVTLHGLSGGSHEFYLRHVLAPLVTSGGGWEACVINSRGCANSKITNGVLYNARSTWDTRQTVKWLKKTFPNRPLYGMGFSLGANILTNYLGEEGPNCLLKAAVLCSNPWNLETGSAALQSSWLGLNVYSKTMASNMKRMVENHAEMILKHTEVDLDRLRKTNYMHEFDSVIQCPSWGYPTVGAYYRDSSSSDSLLAVKIPVFAIHADDDPIAVEKALPYDEFKRNPYAVLCSTSTGGHLAWFEIGGGRWFVKPVGSPQTILALWPESADCAVACTLTYRAQITRFLNTMANDIVLEAPSDTPTTTANGVDRTNSIHNFNPMRRKMQMRSKS
ncbi:MAG: hypothetical protein M1832_006410 [Thelocarpon impressellum]|nr:MAG: hypothetical protein M1832_006410 [Thelocarpon impressellum]